MKEGLSPSQQFDRVEVNNIVDREYVGFGPLLEDWGTKLNSYNPHATLFGYSLNWIIHPRDGQTDGAGSELSSRLMRKLFNDGRVRSFSLLGLAQSDPRSRRSRARCTFSTSTTPT